jgi:hypothetical protein
MRLTHLLVTMIDDAMRHDKPLYELRAAFDIVDAADSHAVAADKIWSKMKATGRARLAELQAEERRKDERDAVGAPRELQPPAEYMCPITLEMMVDPVATSDGFVYEVRELCMHPCASPCHIVPPLRP